MMLRKAFLSLLIFASSALSAGENLIVDGGFELGLDRATTGNIARWERGGAFRGRGFARLADSVLFFRSRGLENLPGRYTFSVALRASREGVHAKLVMRSSRWGSENERIVTLGTDWRRYALSCDLAPAPADRELGRENIYGCWIENPDGVVIDVDDAAWEAGDAVDLPPESRPRVGIRTPEYANVFVEKEVSFTVGLCGGVGATASNVEVSVSDADGRVLLKDTRSMTAAPNETTEADFRLPPNQYGYFTLDAVVKEGARVVDSHRLHAARVRERYDGRYHPQSFFGVSARANSLDPEIDAPRWRLIRETGARWNRVFLAWRTAEPKDGTYDWNAHFKDETIQKSDREKLNVMLTFTPKNPPWAGAEKNRPDGFETVNIPRFLAFLEKAVERYAPVFDAWENLNEPFIPYDARSLTTKDREEYLDHFMEIQRKERAVFRRLTPTIPVLANVSGFGQFEKGAGYFDGALRRGLAQEADAFSFHFYLGSDPVEPAARIETSLREAQRLLGETKTPLWMTEGSTCANDLFDDRNNHYGEYRQMMMPNAFGYTAERRAARHWVRASIVELAEGMRGVFWFLVGAYTDYGAYNLHSMVRDHWRSPKMIYPAFNAMTVLLDESVPLRRLDAGDAVRAYAFRKDGRAVVPYWHLLAGRGAKTIRCQPPVKSLALFNFMGNEVARNAPDGGGDLPLDEGPYYFCCAEEELGSFEQVLKVALPHAEFPPPAAPTVEMGTR